MLEEPGAHDIGGDLWKDASFLLSLGGTACLVLVSRAVARPDTLVQSVTYTHHIIKQPSNTASKCPATVLHVK